METNRTERFLSEEAISLIALLPAGLTDEWQEKAFRVMGRTKEELAAPEMLEALILATKRLNQLIESQVLLSIQEHVLIDEIKQFNSIITKATKQHGK